MSTSLRPPLAHQQGSCEPVSPSGMLGAGAAEVLPGHPSVQRRPPIAIGPPAPEGQRRIDGHLSYAQPHPIFRTEIKA